MWSSKRVKLKKGISTSRKDLNNFILPVLSVNLRKIIANLSDDLIHVLEEIRIRKNRPLQIVGDNKDFFINKKGQAVHSISSSYFVTEEDIYKTISFITDNSVYAYEEEIKNGFVTIRGGHRVGLCGKAVMENGKIITLKNIYSLNIRIAREIKGCSNNVLPYLISPDISVYNTLIASPPQCGKTTLIRDIARQLSNGNQSLGLKGMKVGIVDERSEIASCYKGEPQKDVGLRTDVLDACPKALGMIQLIRSMSPNVIVVDEIGRREDVYALEEALNAGVRVVATIHGASLKEIRRRPVVRDILEQKVFERIVFLNNKNGPGSLDKIFDAIHNKTIYKKQKGGSS